MLANAKKIQKRNEKRRLEAKGDDSDDDGDDDDARGAAETLDDLIRETDSEDEENEEEDKKKKKGRKNQFKTRLHEDGEDFVDFLSTTAAQSLTVKKDQRGISIFDIFVRHIISGTQILLTSLAPSSHWVSVNSYSIRQMKRVRDLSNIWVTGVTLLRFGLHSG